MANIKDWIKDKLGNTFIPKTLTSAVYDDNNIPLSETLDTLNGNLSKIQTSINTLKVYNYTSWVNNGTSVTFEIPSEVQDGLLIVHIQNVLWYNACLIAKQYIGDILIKQTFVNAPNLPISISGKILTVTNNSGYNQYCYIKLLAF